MEIEIHQAILHIFDVAENRPVYSERPLPLSAETLGYIKGLVQRSFNGDGRKLCQLPSDSPFLAAIQIRDFVEMSQAVSEKIFVCLQQQPKIPPADLLLLDATIDGQEYLAMLKCNHKTAYLHTSDSVEGSRCNAFLRQIDTLPPPSTRVDEAFYIALDTYAVRLFEKKVELDGAKGFYLSSRVLECPDASTDKEKLKVLQKASEEAIRRHYPEVASPAVAAGAILNESREQLPFEPDIERADEEERPAQPPRPKRTNELSIAAMEEQITTNYPLIREEFMEALRDNGIEASGKVELSPTAARKMENADLRTESGIRITIPADMLENSEAVEFMPNSDGSVSLLIKHVTLR